MRMYRRSFTGAARKEYSSSPAMCARPSTRCATSSAGSALWRSSDGAWQSMAALLASA
jgi:hypothetical protein